MSHSGVSVRMMSHKCGSYESEWSKCERKSEESLRIVTEDSYGGCIDVDIEVEVKSFSGLQFYLMLKEFLNKCFKVWDFDVLCSIRW